MNQNDTICAIATAQGGAIGIIRVSGNKAIDITSDIFKPIKGLSLTERKPYTVTFGHIMSDTGEIIDEVLVSVFRAPHSYTGEDSVEISCHGSQYILQQIILRLIEKGCRGAQPGEYTQRAFLNGKMDLSQAEAVADLIASSSAASHRVAMNQMRGGFSKEISTLRDKLLNLTSLLELEIDFSDHEELEFANRDELMDITNQIETATGRLVASFKIGNAIKNGIPVAIIGETNAGKSTLLNTLVGEERAIVSNIHGTTRDVIEDTANINDVIFRFMDTAGIRETDDVIENIGIERTFKTIKQSQIILWLIDSTKTYNADDAMTEQILNEAYEKEIIIVCNKTDISSPENLQSTDAFINGIKSKYAVSLYSIHISAKNNLNIDKLKQLMITAANIPAISHNDIIITNIRHYEALSSALNSIRRVKEGLKTALPSDLISQDLRECIHHLSDITGEINTDITLENIFKNFCIGK
ncbi:MAG: tRNA uridine-5-carboxymethylaminomethyl(34) synthesis GTPase MnmE [Prevotella sp.]